MKRLALVVAGVVVALLVSGAVYEYVAQARTTARFGPPGKLVRVGNQRLHVHCTGPGGPTVAIEAGGGSFSLDWQPVQDALDDDMRVCTYDRPGLGWSPPADPNATDDPWHTLHELLAAAGESGPYVLVGHSLGGLYVQRFARAYPGDVAGVVLVDSAHPEQHDRLPESVLGAQESMNRQLRLYSILARFGVPRLAVRLGLVPSAGTAALTPSQREARMGLALSPTYFSSLAAEISRVSTLLERTAAADADAPFPDVPLVVLARGKPENAAGLTPAQQQEGERAWQALQRELATLTSAGETWIADASGHNIMLEQPGIVVDAVRHVMAPWPAGQSEARGERP